VERASHRPRLDKAARGQGAADVAGPRRLAPDAHRKLGGGGDLCLDTAEAANDPGDVQCPDRIQQVPLHAPSERLPPGDLHSHAAQRIARSAEPREMANSGRRINGRRALARRPQCR
jgi:hypothetical protein